MPRIADDLDPLLTGSPVIVTATHAHPDHISGAPALAALHGAQMHVPATTLTYLTGDATPRTPGLAKLARTWPLLFGQPFDTRAAVGFLRATSTAGFGTSRGMLWPAPLPPGGLDDGAPLPGAPDWTVIAAPGHTDDSIAFWHEPSRTLISGDAAITMRGYARFAPDTVDDVAATTGYLDALRQKIADLRLGRPVSTAGSGTDPSAAAAAIPLDSGSVSDGGQNDGGQDRLATTQQDLAVLEAERGRLLKNLKPAHPKIRQLDSKIAEDKNAITVLRSQQKEHRSDQIASLDRERAALEKEVEQKQAHLDELNNNLGKYQNLKSKVDGTREVYNKLANQLQNIDLGKRLEQEPIAILENASPAARVAKSRSTTFLLFGLLGLGVGLVGIALSSRLAPRFLTVEAVLRTLNLPIKGKILRDPWITKQRTVLDCTPEHVGIAESFRHLRSSIQRRPQELLVMQCLAVTSAVPREGKSLIATNLAIALAAANARTLLIDGDMRRGKLHQLLGGRPGPGFSDLLTHQKSLAETLQETRMPHLFLMSCGRRIQNITEHLLSFGLSDLRQKLNAQFDYILIDTPPVLAVDDGVSLAASADATLFVVRLGLSRPSDSIAAIDELKSREIRVSGLVVNSVSKHFGGRRFYKHYSKLEDGRPFLDYPGGKPALPA